MCFFLSHCWIPMWRWVNAVEVGALFQCWQCFINEHLLCNGLWLTVFVFLCYSIPSRNHPAMHCFHNFAIILIAHVHSSCIVLPGYRFRVSDASSNVGFGYSSFMEIACVCYCSLRTFSKSCFSLFHHFTCTFLLAIYWTEGASLRRNQFPSKRLCNCPCGVLMLKYLVNITCTHDYPIPN